MRRWSGGQRLRVEGQVGGPGTEQCRCCARLWRQRPHCCWHWPRPSLPTLRRSTSVRTMQHHITAVICGHRCTHTHTNTCTWAVHSKAALCVWANNYRPVSITPDTFELLLVLLDLLCCLALERFLHHIGVPAQNLLVFNHNLVLFKHVERKPTSYFEPLKKLSNQLLLDFLR